MNEMFRRFSQRIAKLSGSVWAFLLAVLSIVIWLTTGPIFHYSNTWQLVVNTGTTVVTFLMVFIIQNTQNRDNKAMHLKMDELIRAVKGARLSMLDAEELPDDKLDRIREEFKIINEKNDDNAIPKVKKFPKNLAKKEPDI